MRSLLRILPVLGLLLAAGSVSGETLSEKTLKDIVARQKTIFAQAEADKDHLDEAWLRGEIQAVINSYDILIQKEGFQTQRIREHVRAPWYAYPPFDLLVENFTPVEVQDFRVFTYEMAPMVVPNADQLKAEGDGYRQRAAALPPPRFPEPPEHRSPLPADATLPPPRPTSPNSPPSPPG